jgi:hypothetical protein
VHAISEEGVDAGHEWFGDWFVMFFDERVGRDVVTWWGKRKVQVFSQNTSS